jgi:ribosomal protein S18 acetylase RimI-like enzyme
MTRQQEQEPIRIHLAGPEHIAGAADALARAFYGEGFTNWILDLSTPAKQERFARVIRVGMELLRQQGETILVAMSKDEPVGVAIVETMEQQAQTSLWAQIHWMLPYLPLLLSLLGQIRWRRLPTALRVKQTPRHVRKGYYTLMIAVAPEQQGRGIGTRLLDAVRDLAQRDPDTEGVYLFTVGERNRRFYERSGYRVLSRIEGAPELVVYHMILPLDATAH